MNIAPSHDDSLIDDSLRRVAQGETVKKIVANPDNMPHFFATIYGCVDVDYRKYLYAGDRPVPVTDQRTPIPELYAS